MLIVRDSDYNGHNALFMYSEADREADGRIGQRDTLTVLFDNCTFTEFVPPADGPTDSIGTLVTPGYSHFWVFEDWSLRMIDDLTPEMRAEVRAETRGF